jgi:hypothetical protein
MSVISPFFLRNLPLRDYILWEVPLGGGGLGLVNALPISAEVRDYKKKTKSLLEDPQALAAQLDQFLGHGSN